MAYLTKEEIKGIIQNAPAGTDAAGIIAELRNQGHTLEGYLTTQKVSGDVIGSSEQSSEGEQNDDGFLKSVAKTIIRPFASFAADVGTATRATGQLLKGDIQEAGRTLNEGTFIPGFGNLKPQERPVQQGIGRGLEIGSFFVGGKPVVATAKQAAKVLGVSGLASGVGYELQKEDTSARKVIAQGAIESAVSSALPFLGKLVRKPVAKGLAKSVDVVKETGQKFLGGAGEILTGVPKEKIRKWYTFALNDPEGVVRVNEKIIRDGAQPFLGLAKELKEGIDTLKRRASDNFTKTVESLRETTQGVAYNLDAKLPELNETLNKFNLSIKAVKDTAGKFTTRTKIIPTTRTSPYSAGEITQLEELVRKMRFKNMSIDEVVDWEKSVRKFFDGAVSQQNKTLTKLGYELVRKSRDFIDETIPELQDANNLYRQFYNVDEKLGRNIMDKSGNIKRTAESFLGNIMNLNKGKLRDDAIEAGRILGINIVEQADMIKIGKSLHELVPASVKNRTIDVIKGIGLTDALRRGVSSDVFRGGAVAGTLINPPAALSALFLSVMTAPAAYRHFIEIIAGASKKLDVQKAIDSLPKDELLRLQRLLMGIIQPLLRQQSEPKEQQ